VYKKINFDVQSFPFEKADPENRILFYFDSHTILTIRLRFRIFMQRTKIINKTLKLTIVFV